MKIAIASGKGGTGKTTVAVNLARVFDANVTLADCDVEEPNAHLFLATAGNEEKEVNLLVPQVNETLCDGCGKCSEICQFSAIVTFGTVPLVFPEMCHGCGGCALICPPKAITEYPHRIGVVETSRADNITLVTGRLDVGVALAPPLIRAVRNAIPVGKDAILDAPPGTSCPVIAAIRETDIVLLVTEPTPFGMHDLTLAVDMVRELDLPFGVIVNRMGSGDDRVQQFCEKENISILLTIPDDRRIAENYSRGVLMVDALPEYREIFKKLIQKIREQIGKGEKQHAHL
ncbi:MAG: ATP-binding protein [Smithellaceae bacterium]|nr:ATP-binding protein [Smithellaceae bacterium]